METKRLILAFVLSAAVFIAWTLVFPPEKPPRPVSPAVTPAAAPASSALLPKPPEKKGSPVPAAPAEPVEPIQAAVKEEVTVDTPLFTARLSNEGGNLVSFILKRYRDSTGRPLDLVHQGGPYPGRTLALDPEDPFLSRAAASLWTVEREGSGAGTTLRFRYRERNGDGLLRIYSFGNDYPFRVALEREGAPAPVGIVLTPGIGNPSAEELASRYTKPGSSIVLFSGENVTRKAKDALKEPWPVGRGVVAAGLEDNYFLTVFLPGPQASVTLRPVTLPGTGGKAETGTEAVISSVTALQTDVFFGPKDLRLLEKLRPGMDKMIDFGWYAILVKPLLWGLRGVQGWVRNWGVAILVITVVIKLLLYPLTHKQLMSMKKMSALQPKVEAIRTKWATKIKQDSQARMKMNEEMMALYKKEGVNPAGGCLPLLIQLPILVAFYNLLAHAIELRQAPFVFWIQDLSSRDPYYVTPILMTITMWLQQQMTPPTGDAAMRRVMNIMPFAMGFFFKDMPSGLVLYWLMQNVLTIAQQMLLNRFTDLGPASMRKAPAKS